MSGGCTHHADAATAAVASAPITSSAAWGTESATAQRNVLSVLQPSPPSLVTMTTDSPHLPGPDSTSPSFQDVLETLADYRTSLAAWRYCPPFILVLGTFGNLMILWVLGMSSGRSSSSSSSCSSSSSSSSSLSIYFRALAVSDLTLLYAGLLRNWITYMFRLEIRDTHSAVCKIDIFLVYVTSMTSAWFLVMMTTQRAVSVVWPHRMRKLHSRKTASVAVSVIVVFCCVLNAHNLYGYDLLHYPSYGRYYCDYLNPGYESFARGPWPWVDMCMSSLLPFSFLLTSNSLLMWKVTSSIREVRKLTSAGRKSQEAVGQRQKQSTSLNLTLVFLSAMFFLLTSPVCVFLILDHYFRFDLMGTGDAHHMATTKLGWALTNLLWYTNSAVNFYLYFLTGSRFRAQVWHSFFCLMRCRKRRADCTGHAQTRSDPNFASEVSSHM